MMRKALVLMGVVIVGSTVLVAQTTNTPPVPPGSTPNPLSLAALIPFVVPLLVAVIKGVVPKIPKVALPILAPILGAGLDIVLQFTGGGTSLIWGAVLGAAGVGLREAIDQIRKLIVDGGSVPGSTP